MVRNMKDSGIEWCGMIPEHWKVMPNKYVMYKKKEVCAKYEGQNILSLTMDGVIVRDLDAGGKMPVTFDGYQIVYPNNLLMCLFDYDVTPRCIGLIKDEGLTSPAYSQFVMRDNNKSGYYYYYYLMIDNTKELLHLAKNLRHSFTEEQLGAINAPVPPSEEQEKISAFLDKKIPEIDDILFKTRKSIEEYKKYKQAVITEAVTKGLDANVPMKDSEVEWIGSIPKSWNVWRLKYLLKEPMQYGANESGIPYEEMLPRYIRITDITSDNRLKDTGKLSLTEDMAKGYILNDGDILFARSGGTVGKSFIFKAEYGKCAFAGYLIKATIDKYVLPQFAYYYTLTSSYDSWKNRIFIQSTIQNIGADKYSNMEIVVPNTIEEQMEIINYLNVRCAEIDALIAKKEAFVEEMEAYKKSLIYEYVTGKKEVL